MKDFKEAQERVKSIKEEFGKLNEKFVNKSQKLMQEENDMQLLLTKEKGLHLKRDNFLWLMDKMREYSDLKKRIQANGLELKKYHSQLSNITFRIDALSIDRANMVKMIYDITLDIKNINETLKKLSDLDNKKDKINVLLKQQQNEHGNLEKIDATITRLKVDLTSRKKSLDKIIEYYENQKKQVDYLQREQSELEKLLDKIIYHISNKSCPVCGTPHQSKEDLIEKVNIQRASQPKEIMLALDKLKNLEAELNIIQKDYYSAVKSVEDLQSEKNDVNQRILAINNSIQLLDDIAKPFNLNIYDENIFVRIATLKKGLTDNKNKREDEFIKLKEQEEKYTSELKSLKEQQLNIAKEIKLREFQERFDKEAIERIKNEALVRKMSIEKAPEIVNEELMRVKKEIEGIKVCLKEQTNSFDKEQKEIDVVKKKINDVSIEEKTINKEIENLSMYIDETNSLYKSFEFMQEIKIDKILAYKLALNVKLSQVKSIKEELLDIEILLDARQTAAIVSKLQDESKSIQEGLISIEKEQATLKKWTSVFKNANKDLLQIKTNAFDKYINQYGPLTSNIQKRLRQVYGFGNIKLFPIKSGILVNVERKGQKNIIPTDYFSESQIQIVLLSLFLSASLTQTWSSFAPVLLDDPITHFDDLNAYAFLDLIRGNMLAETKKSQFIISTCDERLFRLMKHKFSKAEFRTIFYSIESIGEKGPAITCYRT